MSEQHGVASALGYGVARDWTVDYGRTRLSDIERSPGFRGDPMASNLCGGVKLLTHRAVTLEKPQLVLIIVPISVRLFLYYCRYYLHTLKISACHDARIKTAKPQGETGTPGNSVTAYPCRNPVS